MSLDRGKGKFFSKPKIVCQIYGKSGHIAL